jgi:hypothetical protein
VITESDVHAVLTEQAHDISEPDDILARLSVRHRPARRRWIAPIAAAAAVAAVVAGAVALANPNRPIHEHIQPAEKHTLPQMGGIELQYFGTFRPVPHYQFPKPLFEDGQQVTMVDGYGMGEIADVTVYTKEGAFQPSTIRHARPVTIGKIHALFGDVLVKLSQPSSVVDTPTLAWQLSSGRWVTITGWWPEYLAGYHVHLDPLTEAKRIARAFDTSKPHSLLIPFRVGYLPDGLGLEPDGGDSLLPGHHTPSQPQQVSWSGMVRFRAPGATGATVQVEVASQRPTDVPSNTFELGGHRAWFGPDKVFAELILDFGNATVIVSTGGVSRDEELKIGRSIALASNINDVSTWFDAAK